MAQETVILGNRTLRFSEVARVARADAPVTLGEEAHARVERSWRQVQELSESGDAVYGVSTGFGARCPPPTSSERAGATCSTHSYGRTRRGWARRSSARSCER